MSKDLVVGASLDETIRLATALAQSGFYKDIKDAAQGIVKLQIAKEMGLGMRGISDIHIVEGKPTLSYQLILSKVRMFTGPHGTDKYDFKYLRRDDECVEIEWLINGESVGVSKCDTSDAKRMGLASRGTWQKYPRQMRTARAVTEGVNAFMPEVIGGSIYTPDELGDESVLIGGGGDLHTSTVASSMVAPPAAPLTLKPGAVIAVDGRRGVEELTDEANSATALGVLGDEARGEVEALVVEAKEVLYVSTDIRVNAPRDEEEAVMEMITEAVETLDAAEETLEGEVIDHRPVWAAAIKKFFNENAEHKIEWVTALRSAGYLSDEKMTAKKVYESLADSLGPRSLELDLVIKELQQ